MSDPDLLSEPSQQLPRGRGGPDLRILEYVPEAITVHDAHGRLVFANQDAAALCGFASPQAMLELPVEQWVGRFELLEEDGTPLPPSELPGRRLLAGLDAPARLVRFRSQGGDRWSWIAARLLEGSDPPLVVNAFRETTAAVLAERRLNEELLLTRALQKGSLALAQELDHDRLVQRITDEATAICGARFGAFFHNVERDDGASYLLYTISGVPREAFARFEQPRATEVFAPTFRGEGIVRSPDITKDPRFGKMAPHHGMPKGHLPVVSYLAVPVLSASGAVLGGLFFGHPERDRFTEGHARAVAAIATHAAVALEKAGLFRKLRENEARLDAEHARTAGLLDEQLRARRGLEQAAAALRRSERRFRSLVEASSQMVWSTTPEGHVVEDSPSWRNFTGQTYAEWTGMGWLEAVHPDDRARAASAWRDALARGGTYEVEYRVRRADGTYAHTLVRGTPVHDDAGNVAEWIGLNLDISVRVETEEALRTSERTLRLALEAGEMGTWEYDLTRPRVTWSPQIERMHGIPVGSFDGSFEAYQRDIHPDDRAWVLETITRNLESAREHKLLYRIVRPDGSVRWLEAFGTFLRDAEDRPIKLVGVCSDVTERIHAQESKHALRIQKMLEGISDSFAVYDRGFRIVFANEAGTAPLGYRPSEVIGKCVWDLVPGAVGTKFHSELARVLETGEPATFEEYFAPLDAWYEVHAYPVAEVGIAVYSRNVTARRREQAFRERLARYGELRAELGTALSRAADIDSVLEACARAIVAKLGVARAEVWLTAEADASLELKVALAGDGSRLPADTRIPVDAGLLGAIASRREPVLVHALGADARASARERTAYHGLTELAGSPLLVDGRLIGVVAALSQAPLPEDTLVALGGAGDAIAQGVERRRAELALEEHARDLARSNADLQQFAYVASHDLQEPLRMVASYVQLLERRYRDKLDDDARDFIGYAVEGVTRMRRLIEDLLAYSRVGTRGRALAPVPLEHALSEAEQNLGRAIAESGAVIARTSLPEVTADGSQLVQLFQNLLGNAIKFRRDVRPEIRIAARRESDEWVISVSDNGIGIEPQYFDRVFVIFQRLNAREQYPGTGIGLSIAKKIVERHGGRIWVDSQPGFGSTISFTLPAGRAHEKEPP